MKIYEYRIIVPCTVDQYKIGNIYMTAKRSEEESKQVKGEGIETVNNEPFQNEKESGIYTYKIMHFKSRIPSFMRWALPDKYCHCHEKSWNAYPHYHTEYSVPGMGDDLIMNVDSYHVPYKNGEPIPDNLLELSEEDLAIRKVVYLDILDGKPKPEKDRDLTHWTCPALNINEEFSTLRLDKKARKEKEKKEKEAAKKEKKDKKEKKKDSGPESEPPEWTTNFQGEMMVAVKVVKIKFHWRGLQSMVEKFATTSFYHNLFLDAHRAVMSWADKWAPMSLEEVREYEKHVYEQNNALGFEKDDNKPDEEPPAERPAGVPSEPDSSEENENF